MYLKALPILIFSGLIAGAALSNADAATVRRVPLPPQYEAYGADPWAAANGDTAIDLQSDDDQGNHEFSHHDAVHDGAHGGSHGGGRR
jgi:hypothetical protein